MNDYSVATGTFTIFTKELTNIQHSGMPKMQEYSAINFQVQKVSFAKQE